ncbi:unnamed protein product [Malassezia sympodialis ATCC 42132]|uniref:uncharacterized protein n=1 Tax=Malassezia sympodialis (strain ATCC 42132) TaxID=1230383 RepID=UPI0002C245FE|nr:uncharacterized protein MSY001_0704 [Malassezia sympodialis ATCC 42132]CCU97998.1 unnamed protein product [Malassezia sympodialis ATCC 42132]|eukprot:XP_018739320.1 uncharacterized protein MSY001_0704 [Malassezia sympodialis ATCC 42132]
MTSIDSRRRPAKKGVSFCLMVVGASGTGTYHHKDSENPSTANVEMEVEAEGMRIGLTIVDTPGFGDSIDNEYMFNEILSFIERQYDDILSEESRIRRNPRFRDNRVHALIYFIAPTGHSLREMDIELMRRLSPRVNVIPVIGKSDSLSPSELLEFRKRVMEDIEYYGIPIYNFPYDEDEDHPDTIAENSELRSLLPFAVIGSEDHVVTPTGEMVLGRAYPWGTVEVDNPDHCDFARLRGAIFGTHLNDLKEITHDFLYENYRTEKLSRGMPNDYAADASLQSEDLMNQSVRLREEQLRREEEKLREIELRVQREILEKRQELLAKEENLRNLETRMHQPTA